MDRDGTVGRCSSSRRRRRSRESVGRRIGDFVSVGAATTRASFFSLASVFFFLFATPCEGLVTTVRETLRTEIPATASVEVARFGFLSGGEVRVRTRDVEPANANVWALLCPLGVVGSPIEAAGTGAVACEDTITTVYVGRNGCVAMRMTPGSETARVVGGARTMFSVLSCDENAEVTVVATVVQTNPGGDHVSSEYRFSARVFMGFLIVWIIGAAATSAYLWRHRERVTWLHGLLLLQMLTRLAWLFAANRFWVNASKTSEGLPLVNERFNAPNGSNVESVLFIFFLSLNQATFFCTWLVISSGWLITKRRMERWEMFVASSMYVGLFSMNIMTRFMSQGFIMIGFYLAYPGAFANIIANATRNLKSLRLQALMVQHAQNTGEGAMAGAIVAAKESIFRRTQALVFWFISGKIITSLGEALSPNRRWLRYLLGEILDFLIILGLIVLLRARPDLNPFNTHFLRDWEAMFEGTTSSIAGRIASLGLSQDEVPRPDFYVAHVRSRAPSRASRDDDDNENKGDAVIDVREDEGVPTDEGVGCFHLFLVEHPRSSDVDFENLAIAQPDRESHE